MMRAESTTYSCSARIPPFLRASFGPGSHVVTNVEVWRDILPPGRAQRRAACAAVVPRPETFVRRIAPGVNQEKNRMKLVFLNFAVLLLAGSLGAQNVTVTVSTQGNKVITETTGSSPQSATLARVDVCSDGDGDINVSTSRVSAALTLAEGYPIYGSDVVDAVLNVLQQRDVFTRAQKIVAAGAGTATLITALFKTLSPTTIAIVQAAPAIAAAILPAVADARDLAAVSRKILADNTTLALGKKGSGNDCHTGLVVAMSGSVKIDKIVVQ